MRSVHQRPASLFPCSSGLLSVHCSCSCTSPAAVPAVAAQAWGRRSAHAVQAASCLPCSHKCTLHAGVVEVIGGQDGLKPPALACGSSCPVQPVATASRAQGIDSPATQQALQDAMMGGQGSLPAGHPVRVREAVEKAAAARTEEPALQVQLHCILHPGMCRIARPPAA